MRKKKDSMIGKRVSSALLCLTLLSSAVPFASAAMDAGVADQYKPGATDVKNDHNPLLAITDMSLKARGGSVTVDITTTGLTAGKTGIYGVVLPTAELNKISGGVSAFNTTNYANPTSFVNKDEPDPAKKFSERNYRSVQAVDQAGGFSLSFTALEPTTIDTRAGTYEEEYTLILFEGQTKLESGNAYTVATFYLDSDGNSNSRLNSYMVYYAANVDGSAHGSAADVIETRPIITEWGKTTAVDFTDAYRPGYKLLGWEESARKNIMETTYADANAAAANANAVKATYNSDSATYPAPTNEADKDTIKTLYPIWQPYAAKFVEGDAAETQQKTGFNADGTLQVNKAMEWKFKIESDLRTTKNVTVSEDDKKFLDEIGLSLRNINGNGAREDNATSVGFYTLLSGTPTKSTTESKDIKLTLKDQQNNTTSELTITIPAIKAGVQSAPWMDWNTGLEGQGVTKNEETSELNSDGVIYGFFPKTAGSETMPGDEVNPTIDLRSYEVSYNAKAGAAVPADETTMAAAGWSQWRSLSYDGVWQDVSAAGEDVLTTPGTLTNLDGVEDPRHNCFALTDLPTGTYAVRFAGIVNEYEPSEIVYMPITEGGSATAAQPGYVVYFDLNGGTMPAEMDPADAAYQALVEGKQTDDTVLLPRTIPTKDGYTFAGWSVDGGEAQSYPTGSETPAEDILITIGSKSLVVKATWTKAYNVRFDLASGEVNDTSATLDKYTGLKGNNVANYNAAVAAGKDLANASAFEIPYVVPTREGYQFLGWSDGNGVRDAAKTYFNNVSVDKNTTAENAKVVVSGSDITLTAVWGASEESYGAVIYYDWDGTLLGSSIVARNTTEAQMQAVMENFAKTQMSTDADGFGYDGNASDKPLTYKMGYKFDNKWLFSNSGAFECYRDPAKTYTNFEDAAITHGTWAEYGAAQATPAAIMAALKTSVTGGVEVKTAYEAQTNLNVGGTNTKFYSLGDYTYSRYGAAGVGLGTYALKFSLERINADGNPVARLKEPGIVVTMQVGDEDSPAAYSQIRLENKDILSAEVVPDGRHDRVTIRLVDLSSTKTWPGATSVSSGHTFFSKTLGEGVGTDGFIKDGSVGFIYEAAVEYIGGATNSWENLTMLSTFQNAGFNYQGNVITTRRLTTVKNNIISAVTEARNGGNLNVFTAEQMQIAIDNGTISPMA